MKKNRMSIQFCGFGGQGLVLSATVFGTAAVYAGLNAVQTQSYGSEARGGECQAELIISRSNINSPSSTAVDLLVAMSQPAIDRYLSRLCKEGTLVLDPWFVERPKREDIRILEVPVTAIAADEIGAQITANMVMLGFLRQATAVFPEDSLLSAIRDSVPERFIELNIKAAERGKQLALDKKIVLEV